MMEDFAEKYPCPLSKEDMATAIELAVKKSKNEIDNKDILKLLFNCIDLTSLNTEDSADSIREFVDKVNGLNQYFDYVPQVAAMCVYPVFAPVLKGALKPEGVNIAVVSAGFPSSQTFTDVKKLETQRAVDFGANEIDIVLSVGEFQEGNYEFVGEEAPKDSIVYLGVGEKDMEGGRWDRIPDFAEKARVKAEVKVIPPQEGGVSGTQVRSIFF